MRRPWSWLLLVASLVPALAARAGAHAGGADGAGEERLPADPRPVFQHITLRLDPDKRSYSGRVEVDLEVQGAPQRIQFHAEGQRLTRLVLTQGGDTIATERTTGDRGMQTLALARPLARGRAQLQVEFTHLYGTRAVGLYRVLRDGAGYLFTQFQSDDGREAFPMWDEPGFKFPYQFTLEVPPGQQAVCNTPQLRERVGEGGWRRLEFAPSKPLPSYLLALAVGPLEFTTVPGMKVPTRVVTVKGQSHLTGTAVETTPRLLAALEQWFGTPYPYEKLDLIAVPEFAYGAMENAGAIVYRDDVLLLDPATATATQKRSHLSTHAHELAHMWFGDLVTMAWWDDLWLNESFADWMAGKITDQVYPEFGYGLSDLNRIRGVMAGDANPSTRAIRDTTTGADAGLSNVGLVYSKGNAVLGMFERYLGPEVFQRGVRLYLKEHAWKNATAADLWAALDQVSGQKVSEAMATFTDQPGLPALRVVPVPGGVRITQKRASNAGVSQPDLRWRVPVNLKWSDGRTIRTERLLLSTESAEVRLGATVAWVMPNAGGRGYYAWSVPGDMLVRLAEQAATAMDASERVAFMGNLSMLLNMGEVAGDAWLRAVAGFRDDPEPQVLTAMLGNLSSGRTALVPDAEAEAFAVYVRNTLSPALQRIGEERRAGEDELVSSARGTLMQWLTVRGRDEALRQRVSERARRFLTDSTAVEPGLVETVLGIAAGRGDEALFEQFRERAEKAQVPAHRRRYLGLLGAFEDPALEARALEYALSDAVRPTEMFQVMSGFANKDEAAGKRLRQWMYDRYPQLSQKIPPPALRFMPFVLGSGCEQDEFARMRQFLGDPARQAPGIEQTIRQVADTVDDCVRLRQREGEAVRRYLNSLRTN
jgi:alanyl aminopeptidase